MEMLNRLSVNVLMNSVISLLAAALVVLLALGAWGSWSRLEISRRIASNAEASIHLFVALHNIRSDRSNTFRDLNNEKTGGPSGPLQKYRAADTAALQSALIALRSVDFPAGSTAIADFERNLSQLLALHKETSAALSLPKAQRRATLGSEYVKHVNGFIEQLEQLSSQMVQMVKLKDPYVDQLLHLKDLAWATRQNTGDAAVLVSNSLAGIVAPDAILKFQINLGRAKNTFALLQDYVVGLPLPESFNRAIQTAKDGVFGDAHTSRQLNILKAVAAGQKPDMDVATWSPISIEKQGVLQEMAEIALHLTKEYADRQNVGAQRSFFLQIGLLAVALGICVGMLFLVSRRITNPLLKVQKIMDQIAGGDFNTSLPKTSRQDEIGKIVTAVNSMVEQVSATIAGIKASAREVTNASGEIALATTDLSQRTEEQAASLEETSASMAQISDTVRKNAENARRAQQSALSTQKVADHGGEVAGKAVHAMARIEESSGKIGDIIGVIDEIARQTNLLALNAAVEAARAGEAGRGFAVVATEVRSLAQRSSQAAKDIAELITNSGSQVKEGVELVNQAGSALHEIVDSIRAVAALVDDIATASSEQATGLEEVGKALAQMDEVTQRNSALVEENAATAQTLEQQARTMDEQVAYFRTEEAQSAAPARKAPSAERPAKGLRKAA